MDRLETTARDSDSTARQNDDPGGGGTRVAGAACRIRIVGCGAEGMADDAVGLEAARWLLERLPESIDIRTDASGGANAASWCAEIDRLILIDAFASSSEYPAGTLLRLEYPRDRDRLETLPFEGTHVCSVPSGLRLAEVLGVLPPEVRFIGLAIDQWEPMRPLSPTARRAFEGLIQAARRELA